MMSQYNEQELTCSNCKNQFDENNHLPRMLPECGHTFCNQCLLAFLEESDRVECPEDNIVSSRKEVVSFPKNYSLLNILRRSNRQSDYQSPQHTFEHTPVKSNSFSSRKGSLHARSQSGSVKCFFDQDDNFPPSILQNQKRCLDHKKEKDIVCLDCQQAICSSCALFGAHKKHDVSSEEDVMKIISKRAEHLLTVYEQVEEQSTIIKSSQYKEIIHSYLSQNQQAIQKEVNAQFENIIRLLEQRKKILFDEINNLFQKKEQMFLKAIDLSKQNVLTEIEDWKSKAQEKIQNLCEKSQVYELSFDLMENKQRQTPDIIEVGQQIFRQAESNNRAFQEKVKSITLEELNIEYSQNLPNIIDSLVKIKLVKDNQNQQNIKLQESLKQSEMEQKQITRTDFRKGIQYKKAKKYLDDFYNKNIKDKLHYPLKNSDKIFEALDNLETMKDKLDEEQHELRNQIDINKKYYEDHIENEKELNVDDKNLLSNNEDALNSNIVINDEDFLLKSQVISNNFIYQPEISQQGDDKQNNGGRNYFEQHNENVKLCTDDDDENLISQIHNKDFLLSSLSYQNFSMNDINLLDEQMNAFENIQVDSKKTILQSLARDANLMHEDHLQSDGDDSDTNIKEQTLFLNLIQDIFSNTIDNADLSNMGIGDKGLEILSIAIKENNSLHSIKLNGNKITDEGFIKFLDLINNQCYNIQNIYFQNNIITEKSVSRIKELQENPERRLKNIYLNNNNIKTEQTVSSGIDTVHKNNIYIHF